MAVGDLAYPDGTKENFECYDRTWGRVKSRTRPSPGNHEFHTEGATYYFSYFREAAGDPKAGYYSYELGDLAHHRPQQRMHRSRRVQRWLRRREVASRRPYRAPCRVYFSLLSQASFQLRWRARRRPGNLPIWQALYAANADVVVNGHDHDYERFAPQTPLAKPDPQRGIREFVVGTGGKSHRPFVPPHANSEVRNADTFGVLKLTLRPGAYDWQFIPEAGKTFTDSGTGSCH